jgi:hypothetical protein
MRGLGEGVKRVGPQDLTKFFLALVSSIYLSRMRRDMAAAFFQMRCS